jgi:hypothetical protein
MIHTSRNSFSKYNIGNIGRCLPFIIFTPIFWIKCGRMSDYNILSVLNKNWGIKAGGLNLNQDKKQQVAKCVWEGDMKFT